VGKEACEQEEYWHSPRMDEMENEKQSPGLISIRRPVVGEL
tara:strand:+ start:199 stop:321 length:123 start_codon:yes stop_codon:yes gene_type:complete